MKKEHMSDSSNAPTGAIPEHDCKQNHCDMAREDDRTSQTSTIALQGALQGSKHPRFHNNGGARWG